MSTGNPCNEMAVGPSEPCTLPPPDPYMWDPIEEVHNLGRCTVRLVASSDIALDGRHRTTVVVYVGKTEFTTIEDPRGSVNASTPERLLHLYRHHFTTWQAFEAYMQDMLEWGTKEAERLEKRAAHIRSRMEPLKTLLNL